jgi:signal transduction histidine kinase
MRRIPRGIGRGLRSVGRTLAGPWQIYPSALALIAVYGLFVSAGSRTQVGNKTVGSYFAAVLPQWASIIVTCLIIYAVLRILVALSARVRPVDESRLAYVVTLFIASAVITLFIVAATQVTVDDKLRATLPPISVRFILSIPVVVLVLFIGNGVLAAVRQRLARQELLLADRVDMLRSERSLLLAAEEQVRAQASRTLHDDIQAALLRAVVRLEDVRDDLDEDNRRRFDQSIAEIEAVREDRVRALGRVLSPNISDVGLLQALEDLGALYADVMEVEFAFPEEIQERFHPLGGERDLDLALYRIAEQALLNALKHGRSTRARVELTIVGPEATRMVITTDGASPAPDADAGTGTATINAWIDAVGGSWSLGSRPDGGSVMDVVVGYMPHPPSARRP